MRRALRYSRERQRLFHQCQRKFKRVGALRDADFAEILARHAIGPHVISGEKGEARIRPAGAVRIDRIARELAEGREIEAEGVGVIGVAGNAGDRIGIARLHRARRAPQRDDAAGAAHRNVIEPAQRQPKMLRQADRAVRREREARNAQPVEPVLGKARRFQKLRQRAGEKPMRAADRIAHIRHGHGAGDHNIVIGGACAAHANEFIRLNAANFSFANP